MDHIGFVYNFIYFILALFGGLLFTWWWITIGKASDIYAYTTFVLFGVAFSQAISLLTRHLIHGSQITAVEIGNSWWYVFRSLPEFIALSCIVLAMFIRTVRIIWDSRKPTEKKPPPESQAEKDIEKKARCDFPHPDRNPFICDGDDDGRPEVDNRKP